MRALSRALILSADGRIVTTPAKAKEVTPFVHRLITLGRRGDLASQRRALAQLPDQEVIGRLFRVIAPPLAARNGGYTRILHLGGAHGRFRAWSVGDAADKVLFELVDFKPADAPSGHDKDKGTGEPAKKGLMGKIRERLPGKSKSKKEGQKKVATSS